MPDVGRRRLAEPEVGALDHHVDGRDGERAAAHDRRVVAQPAHDAGVLPAGERGADRLDQRELAQARQPPAGVRPAGRG